MAKQAINDHRVTVRLACQAFRISETCYRYDPRLSSENELIADWLLRLTAMQKLQALNVPLSINKTWSVHLMSDTIVPQQIKTTI